MVDKARTKSQNTFAASDDLSMRRQLDSRTRTGISGCPGDLTRVSQVGKEAVSGQCRPVCCVSARMSVFPLVSPLAGCGDLCPTHQR